MDNEKYTVIALVVPSVEVERIIGDGSVVNYAWLSNDVSYDEANGTLDIIEREVYPS